MGLFLAPFSGHSVGGGGHGVIDPPPPGTDPGSGPRAEVDTVGRTPLRLLRTTMARHKPKFMKIVPPGQQRGTIAPPYTWDTLERPDWRYETPVRSGLRMGEGEFDAPRPPKPKPIGQPKAPGATATAPKPHPAGQRQNDPRHARVAQIHDEIQRLRAEIHQLMARQKVAVGQAHQQARQIGQQFNPDYHQQRRTESLSRTTLRLVEADYTPLGIRRGPTDPPHPKHDSFASPDPVMTPDERREAQRLEKLRKMGVPTGLRPQAPKASFEVLNIHREIQAKRQKIQQLTQELKQLRQQMQSRQESAGLTSNNLRRQSLLLK